MSASLFPILVEKYLNQSLTDVEADQLKLLLQKEENLTFFKKSVQHTYLLETRSMSVDSNQAYLKSLKLINKKRIHKKRIVTLIVGILLIVCLIISLYFIGGITKDQSKTPLPPTINYASLHTESGQTYELPNVGVDTLRNGKNDQILAIINNGELIYPTDSEVSESHTLMVPYGVTYNIKLADGSIIRLNSGSEMSYLSSFEGSARRNIAFEGEALFDVSRNEYQPFVITSRNHVVEVLGTRFNIKAYPDDREITTTLEHGRVKISTTSDRENAVLLESGERFIWNGSAVNISNKKTAKSEMPKWIMGELSFKNTTFEAASKKLERAFDVEIIIKSEEIKAYRFTGTFKMESIQKILTYLQEVYDFDYSIKNRTVEIY